MWVIIFAFPHVHFHIAHEFVIQRKNNHEEAQHVASIDFLFELLFVHFSLLQNFQYLLSLQFMYIGIIFIILEAA